MACATFTPFTERKTEHWVTVWKLVSNALYAVDALGTGDMYPNDIEIRSSCRSCGQEIRITTADEGQTLAEVCPGAAVIWYDLVYIESAASSCCRTIAFLCSDEHLERWLEGQGFRTGMRFSISEAFEVGRAFFGPVLRASGQEEDLEPEPADDSGEAPPE